MATRLDKVMAPIIEQKCSEAYQAGYEKGLADGWKNKLMSYENEIEFLKLLIEQIRLADSNSK